jgi:hypothetical protein
MRNLTTYALGISIAAASLAGCGAAPFAHLQAQGDGAEAGLNLHQTKPRAACPCLYVANRNNSSVTVYPIGTSGNVKPLQDIRGSKTGLRYPHDVAVDGNGQIYAANTGSSSVTVYAPNVTGNTKPIEIIRGPKTELALPTGIAIDSVNGDIYVLNNRTDSYGDGSVTVYAPGANGDVAPIGVIAGPSTRLVLPNCIALDASGNIYVTNRDNYITFYPAGSTGDTAPTRTIEGALTNIPLPTPVALDSSVNIYVANFDGNGANVYASGADGNVAPIRYLHGRRTKLGGPFGTSVDAAGDIYVANTFNKSRTVIEGRITVYGPGSNGNAHPVGTIAGDRTGLSWPTGIAVR